MRAKIHPRRDQVDLVGRIWVWDLIRGQWTRMAVVDFQECAASGSVSLADPRGRIAVSRYRQGHEPRPWPRPDVDSEWGFDIVDPAAEKGGCR